MFGKKDMLDINRTFDELLLKYVDMFSTSTHSAATRRALQASVPAKIPGVYVIVKKTDVRRPIYIGSSGKIGRSLLPSGSSIRSRIFGASTPYRFGEAVLQYGPTTTTVPPADYTEHVALGDIQITCFAVFAPKIPAAWEHLLLQGFINQFGDLPVANQKV